MKGSLLIILVFIAGCVIGRVDVLPQSVDAGFLAEICLFILLFQVGLSVGSDKNLKTILKSISPKMAFIPLATITGTFAGSLIAAVFISSWSLSEVMAVGSGFGYYSLSSVLIANFKEASLGPALAGELATVALMANMIREMMTLTAAPVLVKYFGKLAPICAGGVTSMDATLPVISRYGGKDMVFIAIFHGVVLEFGVPLFVSLFTSF